MPHLVRGQVQCFVQILESHLKYLQVWESELDRLPPCDRSSSEKPHSSPRGGAAPRCSLILCGDVFMFFLFFIWILTAAGIARLLQSCSCLSSLSLDFCTFQELQDTPYHSPSDKIIRETPLSPVTKIEVSFVKIMFQWKLLCICSVHKRQQTSKF